MKEASDYLVIPNGEKIRAGDFVVYSIAGNKQKTEVVLFDGVLCMKNNFMYGENTSIAEFIKKANYYEVYLY